MPRKPVTTKETIIDGAVQLIREKGYEALTVRNLAEYLHCSTQPIMYQFETVEDLRRAAYRKADQMHTDYLMIAGEGEDPILAIGLNYIRFAVREPNLFRFLFQSGNAEEKNLLEMIDSEELVPVLGVMQEALGMDPEKTRQVFLTVALFAHGYASIIANNGLEFDEAVIARHLEQAWNGALRAAMEDTK